MNTYSARIGRDYPVRMPGGKTNVYIDGFNLYYGCIKGSAHHWLNLEALCARLLPNDNINRIRYFTALVSPRAGDPMAPSRQRAYLRALRTLPLVSIHLGHFLTNNTRMPRANPQPGRSATVEVIKTEEKGSDVNLASYLLLDGFRTDYDTAVVLSNDSDLKEPVRMVRHELSLRVGVINPHSANKRSRALSADATFFKQLRPSVLGACHLPHTLTDADGTFSIPQDWV